MNPRTHSRRRSHHALFDRKAVADLDLLGWLTGFVTILVVCALQNVHASWSTGVAFPNLTFTNPVFLLPEPRSSRLYVCEREGRVWFFRSRPAISQKTLFLDLSDVTQGFNDCGLLGMAFHPEFRLAGSTNRGFVYVYYCWSPAPTNQPDNLSTPQFNRLSRFTVPDGSVVADRSSEQVLINQFDEQVWHNGGGMFFGPDGFLYLSEGDEGGIGEQFNNAQVITNGIFSGVLRIDVDQNPARSHPIRRHIQDGGILPAGWPHSFSGNYYIPNDNPWQDPGGSILEEFYAIGLRNPHRMTYDPPSGRIWVGDVGQSLEEEIDIIEKAGSYQWSYREGEAEGPKSKPASIRGTEQPPLFRYGRSLGRCVIGGYVYRGPAHASLLEGSYIFGDYASGTLFSLAYDGVNPPAITRLCDMQEATLSSFGIDQNNELYMCSMLDGKIWTLLRLPDPSPIVVSARQFADRVQLQFTNVPGLTFSILGSTNLGLSPASWTPLGHAQETEPGIYIFDPPTASGPAPIFFRVRQP